MSGEVASREAQAAEVLDEHERREVPAPHCTCCECLTCRGGWDPKGDDAVWCTPEHQAAMLAAAGLLAPPPPRTWTAGDQGPISASVVTDAGGEPWLYVGAGMWLDGSTRIGWYGLLDKRGPVTEVLTRAGQ